MKVPAVILSYYFLLASAACAGLACLLLSPGLSGGYVFDDGPNIVSNTGVHLQVLNLRSLHEVVFGSQPGGVTRILPTLSFAFDYWRGGGLNPSVFKATNLVIHGLTTIVLALFFRQLLVIVERRRRSEFVALLMALLWAIHPLQVSSVLYVVQRMQTMGTLFMLLGLLAYLKARQAQIEGDSGRTGLMAAFLCWMLAMGCKEDSVLLPIYTFILEAVVLRFRAKRLELAAGLKRIYLILVVLGGIFYLAVVVPHYWSWDAYPFRDFSTYERLLTQGRVLIMYLGQIFLPFPRNLPFYYDWLQPSRGLLQPWSTFPALLLVLSLLVLAYGLRKRRPFFSFGIFIFFSSHLISSNVVGLELAFEHRNHFALVGVMLALGDLVVLTMCRRDLRLAVASGACIVLLLAASTVERAIVWGDTLELARKSAEFAPKSARAWNSLCLGYFNLGGGRASDNPYLDKAITACSKGASVAPYSVASLTNLVVFKSIRGDIAEADWKAFLGRLDSVPMTPENRSAIWVIINNANQGVVLNEVYVLEAIEIVVRRKHFSSVEYAAMGYFILGQTSRPEVAYSYFERSVKAAPAGSALPEELVAELRVQGHEGWATSLDLLRHPVSL
ncbi:hypothetical protein D3C81_545120 [compost metagenome]